MRVNSKFFNIILDDNKSELSIFDKRINRLIINNSVFGLIYKKGDKILDTRKDKIIQCKIRENEIALTKTTKDVKIILDIKVDENLPMIELFMNIRNNSKDQPELLNSVLLEGNLPICYYKSWKFFEHGWNTVSQSKYKKITEKSRKGIILPRNYNSLSFDRSYGYKGNEIVSEMFSVATNEDDKFSILAGATTTNRQYSQVYWYLDGSAKFRLTSQMDGINLEKNQEIKSEKFFMCIGNKSFTLKAYSEKIRENMKPPIPEKNYSGWCSWYYYGNKINEKIILKELRATSKLRKKIPLKYFIIDDGYCTTGDWLEPHKVFPNGMKFVSNEIRKHGLSPGIWLTPYLIDKRSKIYKKHQEWILKNKKNDPILCTKVTFNPIIGFEKWNKYTLDPTHPEVKEWISYVIDTMVNEWKYELLKLDFLHSLSMSDNYYDENITRAKALRVALETIRKAAGNETHITGAITPLSPCIGIFNSMRISTDIISPPLAHLPVINRLINKLTFQNNFRNITHRKFMHKNFWSNDPDCLVTRPELKLDKNTFSKYYGMIREVDYQIFLGDSMIRLSKEKINNIIIPLFRKQKFNY